MTGHRDGKSRLIPAAVVSLLVAIATGRTNPIAVTNTMWPRARTQTASATTAIPTQRAADRLFMNASNKPLQCQRRCGFGYPPGTRDTVNERRTSSPPLQIGPDPEPPKRDPHSRDASQRGVDRDDVREKVVARPPRDDAQNKVSSWKGQSDSPREPRSEETSAHGADDENRNEGPDISRAHPATPGFHRSPTQV